MKPIRLSVHALSYTEKRGFTTAEVEDAISSTSWLPCEYGANRLECSKEFPYGGDWNGKLYASKRVRPIQAGKALRPAFVDEDLEIVVVTVYTYYY